MTRRVLLKEFYIRSPELVARDLLGKTLVRTLEGERLEGTIVETEAYFGQNDPASRAFHGKKKYNCLMWDEPGRLFVYNVHKYWMLNVIAHEAEKIGGVLFRAIEPIMGLNTMRRLRPLTDDYELTNGPGKLSCALGINKELNGYYVTDPESPVSILDAQYVVSYNTSKRIGVTRDLQEELRFYIHGNKYVSK